MTLRQRVRLAAGALTAVAACGALGSGADASSVVLVLAAVIVARCPFGVLSGDTLDEVIASLRRQRDVSHAHEARCAGGESVTSAVRGLTAPLLVSLPLPSRSGSKFGLRRYGLLFRDEATAETWRELTTELRMQRDNHPEQKNFAIWRTALAKQLGL